MNNMPQGDVWAIRNDDESSLDYGKDVRIDFTGLARKDLEELLKAYVWHEYRSRNIGLSLLAKRVGEIKRTFHVFMVLNGIECLNKLTVEDVERYQTYLNLLLNQNGKPYSRATTTGFFGAFRVLIAYGQVHRKVRFECVNAIRELIDYTADFRKEADESINEYLFIRKTQHGVLRINRGLIGDWIHNFPHHHDIRGKDGEIYRLTSHQFRRTLATDMISSGVNISVIQSVLGHSTPATTSKYYADIKDKQRIEMFQSIGVIGNIRSIDESIIADADDLEWFKENAETTARMCDGYCTKPVRNGEICDRLLKRQKCLTCSRFITTPEYLDTHRQHLTALEKELGENTFGDHYASHLVPTVEALREIIQRLEVIVVDSEQCHSV